MKRRAVTVEVTDHAVLRWLEHAHGLDLRAVKRLIASKVRNGAELEAVAVVVDQVRFVLRDRAAADAAEPVEVAVTTTLLERHVRTGVGADNGRMLPATGRGE